MLCVVHLAACESLVGIKDIVPIDSSADCVTLEPVDFATKDVGIVDDFSLFVMHILDITGDGKSDLMWVSDMGKLMRNTTVAGSAPTFAPTIDPFPVWNGNVANPFADLNGDRKIDVVGNPEGGGVLNTTPAGASIPTFGTNFFIDVRGMVNSGLVVGNLNADTRPDVVAWAGTDAYLRVNTTAVGATTLTFAALVTVAMAPAGNVITGIQVGDISGDGKPDLVAASENPSSHASVVSVAINTTGTGALTFAARVDFPQTLPGALYFAIGDIDRDGKIDVVVGGSGIANRIRLLRNTTPTGANAAAFSNLMLEDNQFAVVRDLDGDGKLDIAYYSNTSRAVIVRINTTTTPGVPQFMPPISFTAFVPPYRVFGTDDLNGDGRADMITLANEQGSGHTRVTLWLSGSHCAP